MKEQEDRLLTITEVAKQLRVEGATVRRWIKNGVLEAIALPRNSTRQSYRVKQSILAKVMGE